MERLAPDLDLIKQAKQVRGGCRVQHWGYFARSLQPVAAVEPGDFVTIETLTHHAYNDYARMDAGIVRPIVGTTVPSDGTDTLFSP
jgi:hypothetical protein